MSIGVSHGDFFNVKIMKNSEGERKLVARMIINVA